MEEKEIVLKLYHNVSMGLIGIDAVMGKIKGKKLKKLIKGERKEYLNLRKKYDKLCKTYQVVDKDLKPFIKIQSDLMVNIKMLMNQTDASIAKMMIEGTNKGLIELQELKNHCKTKKLTKYIEELINIENKNNNDLKLFL